MPRHIHDDDDRVYACPECDKAGDVYRRVHKHKDFDTEFICHKCGHEFDDPIDRKSFGSGDEQVTDDDGLPVNLNPDAKRLIRQARGSE